MDDPWGNAWSEVDKDPVQEVILKPTDDKWITSPVSGDIGVAWTSEWQVPSDKKTTLEPSQGIFPSTSAPWESALGTMGDPLSSVNAKEPATSHAEEYQPEDEPSHPPVGSGEPLQADEIPAVDDAVREEAFPKEDRPTSGVFDDDEVITDSWRSLSHAAVVVGDEAAWDSAWKPPADEMDEKVEKPQAPVVDEWTRAIEEKAIRDTRIPQEVMEMILHQFDELSEKMWPSEDLASARGGPAPRDEWQGGLENVEGLTPLVNRYMPPPPTAPPIRFASTRIATSFQNAMKLTRSYGIVQNSPLSKLIKASDTWEQSAKKDKQFSLESWLLKGSAMPLSSTSMNFGALDTHQSKPAGIKGILSRSSLDRGRASSSSSPAPRTSQDLTSQMTPTSTVSVPTSVAPVGSSDGVSSPTTAPASTSTPSAVTRFLNRWSRRADDSPKPATPVNLKSEELDFLDTIPDVKQGSQTAEAIQRELGGASGYPGAQSMTFGAMMPAASLNKLKKRTIPTTTNLSQLNSADFESLLEQQIIELEVGKTQENLIALGLIPEPNPSAYSNLSASFFGKQPIPGALPLNQKPTSQMSNALFDDDDDFDAFLEAPAQPAQTSVLPTAPTSYPEAPLPSIPRTVPYNTPAVAHRASPKTSPIPLRAVAIMNQSGSRPSTPSILAAAPLLPPPPGRTGSINLLNGSALITHPPSQRNGTPTFTSTGTGSGMTDLGNLLDFTSAASPASPKLPLVAKPTISNTASANTGGLSAQDLSFFEGL